MTTSPLASLRGALRPRVDHRPDGVVDTSLVPLARDLSGMAGLPPDPWQGDSHEVMLGLREDGNFAAADYCEVIGRQQGKTGGVGVPRLLVGLFLLPERRFLWSAHLASAATEAFEMTREALLTLGEEVRPDLIEIPPLELPGALREPLFVQVISANGKEGFRTWTEDRRLAWRKRVLMVSRSRGGGRGIPADVRFIDEGFAYTAPQQAALAPTRLARPFAQTLYFSSPPLSGDEGEVMYRLRERAEVDRDPRLGYRDWGLALTLDEFMSWPVGRRKAFLFDPANWVAALPALGLGRVTAESVETLLKEFVDDADAAREVLCLWPVKAAADGRWQVISKTAWQDRGGGDADAWGPDVVFTVAMPPEQDYTSIAVAGRSLDGAEILVQLVRWDAGSGWALPQLLELTGRHPGSVVAIDPHGPAGHLIAPLERAFVEVLTPNTLQTAHGAQRFVRGVVQEPVVRHFDQEALDIAVKVALKRNVGDGWTWFRRGGTDISPVDAASLAVWAVNEMPPGLSPVSAGGNEVTVTNGNAVARMGF